MKGKLLSYDEIMALNIEDKVWIEYKKGELDEKYSYDGIEYINRFGELTDNGKKGEEPVPKKTMASWSKEGIAKVYEWIEEPKSEQTITKTEKEDNTYNKTYKGSEILAMIEDGKLKDDDIIINNKDEEDTIIDLKRCYNAWDLFELQPFTIKQKPVDFMTAVNSEKLFRVEHKFLSCVRGDMELSELFSFISDLGINDTDIRDIINNGKYYLSY